MPTFLVFKSGREVARIQGADPKKLENAVKAAIVDVSTFEGQGRKLGDVPASVGGGVGGVGGERGGKMYMSGGRAVQGYVFICVVMVCDGESCVLIYV